MDAAPYVFVGFGLNSKDIIFRWLFKGKWEVRLFSENKYGYRVITLRRMEKSEDTPAEDWRQY